MFLKFLTLSEKIGLAALWPFARAFRFIRRKKHPFLAGSLIIVLLLGPVAYLFSSQPKPVAAGWWDDTWHYRQSVPITYSETTTLTEYQVFIEDLDTATLISDGKMQSDCNDIRFTSQAGVLLDYSIVATTCNTATTQIWVQVDTIPENGTTIYFYYGNPSADSYQSEENTFSYSSEKTVGYILHSAVDDLQIISLANNNSISHNSVTRTLAKYETSSFTSISQFGAITAKGLFNADDTSDNTDLFVPVSWAGTEFYFYSRSDAQTLYLWMIAPWGNATVTAYLNGVAIGDCTSVSVTSAGSDTTCASVDTGVIRVSSDVPILLFTQPTDTADHMPVHPATSQKWLGGGQSSRVENGNASLDYRHIADTEAVETDPADAAANTDNNTLTGDSTFGGGAILVRSANSEYNYGINQIGDGDGGDGHYFNDVTEQGTIFGAANQADYISIASTQAATCTVYEASDDSQVGTGTATSSNTSVYHLGLGTGNTDTYTTAAWYMECDKPVVAHYQKATVAESNLMHYPMMRQYVYPAPAVGTLGSEEKGTSPIAYWSFDEGYGTTAYNKMEKNGSDGLVSWWKFDDASSGTSPAPQDEMIINDCSWTNNAAYTSTAYLGNAATFDGTDDYVDCGSDASLRFTSDGFTLMAWVRATDTTAEEIVNSDDLTNGYGLLISSGKLRLVTRGTTDESTDSTTSISADTWTHITGVYTGTDGDRILYINGTKDATESFTGTANIADDPVYIGTRIDGSNDFNGQIDEVKIFNRVLTDREIEAEYNSNHGHMINMDPSTDWVDGAQPNSNQKVMGRNLDFDGANDYIDVNNTKTVQDVQSVSVWIRPDSTTESIIDLDGGTHYIHLSSGTVTATGFSSPTIYVNGVVSSTVAADVWSHVVVTTGTAFDGSNITIARQSTNYYDGEIDELKIYDFALSAAQVEVQYNRGFGESLGVGEVANKGNDPVGFWKLDEDSGFTAFDSSGNENHGTMTNMDPTTDWVQGKIGKALDFDGSDDYVTLPDLDFTNAVSGSLWVKFDDVSSQQMLIAQSATTEVQLQMMGSAGDEKFRIRVDTAGGNPTADSTTQAMVDVWYFVAFTYDGSDLNVYVNGVYEGTSSSGSGNLDDNNLNWAIGARTTEDFPTDGVIDHVKIYDYVRTEDQIHRDMATGSPIAHWSFDEGKGTTVHNLEEENGEFGLVSWWKFDDAASGTSPAPQDEMAVNDGTWGGNAAYTATAKLGNAADFDGTDDYIDLDDVIIDGLTEMTATAWINPTTIEAGAPSHGSAGNAIVDKSGASDDNLAFLLGSSDEIYFYIDTGSDYNVVTTTSPISTGSWQHVAAVYDGSTLKIYVNAVEEISGSASGTIIDNANGLNIGNEDQQDCDFDGQIDEVKIFSRALSAGEISEMYNSIHGHMINMDANADWVDGTQTNPNQKVLGRALDFDGSDDYMEIADNTSLDITGQITMSVWVNTTADPATHKEIISKNSGAYEIQMTGNNDTLKCFVESTGLESAVDIINTGWRHFICTYDGTNINIYLDGSLEDSTPLASFTTTNSNDLYIGSDESGGNNFTGKVDEVKIYNYALTAAEVAVEYNRGKALVLGAGENDSYPGTSNLVGWWKLDEAAAYTAFDSSGNDNHGEMTNMDPTTDWVQGKIGKSLNFDGSDDYVDLGGKVSSTTTKTLTAWVYVTASTNNGIVSQRGTASSDFMWWVSTTTLVYYRWTGSGTNRQMWQTDASTVPLNEWVHVASTYDDSTAVNYVNGVALSSTYTTGTNSASSENTIIGDVSATPTYEFNGDIDQVKIYDTALTPAQIAWEYNQGQPMAHWRLDEGQGVTAYDESDNDIDGTFDSTNPPTWSTDAQHNASIDCELDNSEAIDLGDVVQYGTQLTISAWIKPETIVANGGIVGEGQAFRLYTQSDGDLSLFIRGDPSDSSAILTTTSTPLSAGNWYHVAGVWDGDNATWNIYVDGIVQADDGTTNDRTAFDGSDSDNGTICQYFNGSGPFDGIVDEVKIYNYALTADQIKVDYNNSKAVRYD